MDRQERIMALKKFSHGKRVSVSEWIFSVVWTLPVVAVAARMMMGAWRDNELVTDKIFTMGLIALMAGFFLLPPVFILRKEIRRIRRNVFNTKVEIYREQGKLDALLDEFESARPVLRKNLRLGEENVFSRQNETAFFPYGEIARLYWERETDNDGHATDYLTLQVRPDGAEKPETLRVCSIGKGETDEAYEVARFMKEKNPEMQNDLRQQQNKPQTQSDMQRIAQRQIERSGRMK